jgi:hypothetical protein
MKTVLFGIATLLCATAANAVEMPQAFRGEWCVTQAGEGETITAIPLVPAETVYDCRERYIISPRTVEYLASDSRSLCVLKGTQKRDYIFVCRSHQITDKTAHSHKISKQTFWFKVR